MNKELVRKAEALLRLHQSDRILVLLNAWDVASARVFESAGAHAIGTTSMGIAASAGYPDIQQIPFSRMVDAVSRIAGAVNLPVTADMEAGYGDTPDEVASSVTRVIHAGAVGINIEDGTGNPSSPLIDISTLADRIGAIRKAATDLGIHLVINARTDTYLTTPGSPGTRLAETIERCNAYAQAGSDCVFVPGGLDRDTIRELVREIQAPLNVVANPAISIPVVPDIPELEQLGVSRVSVGSGPMRAALALTRRIAAEVLNEGSYHAMKAELDHPLATEAYEAAIGK